MTGPGYGVTTPCKRSEAGPVLRLRAHIGCLDAAAAVRVSPPSSVPCQTGNSVTKTRTTSVLVWTTAKKFDSK